MKIQGETKDVPSVPALIESDYQGSVLLSKIGSENGKFTVCHASRFVQSEVSSLAATHKILVDLHTGISLGGERTLVEGTLSIDSYRAVAGSTPLTDSALLANIGLHGDAWVAVCVKNDQNTTARSLQNNVLVNTVSVGKTQGTHDWNAPFRLQINPRSIDTANPPTVNQLQWQVAVIMTWDEILTDRDMAM